MWHRGDVVRKLRLGQNWSQADLAKRSGLGEKSVARAEDNQPNVSMDVWYRLATALGTTVEEMDRLLAATTPVTSPVTFTGHPPTVTVERPPMETPKTRLLHFVSSLTDEQATVLLPLVLQWFAQLIARTSDARGSSSRK